MISAFSRKPSKHQTDASKLSTRIFPSNVLKENTNLKIATNNMASTATLNRVFRNFLTIYFHRIKEKGH